MVGIQEISSSFSTTSLALVLPSLLLILALLWRFMTTKPGKNNLPPSPPKVPVLGNLLQLGLLPHRTLASLADHYGPVMLLHLGSVPTLVVSSAEAAKEIVKTHDLIFANRPDASIQRRLLYDYKDLALAPYSEYWRQMRSICVLQLLSSKRVQSFRPIREEETVLMVEKIEQTSLGSSPVDLSQLFACLTNDVVCRVAFGKKYSGGDGAQKFKKIMEEFGALLGTFNIADFVPWLGWVNNFNGLNARVEKVFGELDAFFGQIVDHHLTKNGSDLKEDDMDFVDVLLRIQKNGTDGVSIGIDNIKAMILDMFAAGTDTTQTALEWAMTELLRHPNVMNQATEEIRHVVGNKHHVLEDDLPKMIYLKSVIKESFRLHPPIPLLVPRESTEDAKIQGYDIPAKTRVFINSWAIARDPSTWDEPEKFRPNRFVNSSVDFRGNDMQLIPFGSGRRGCPGTTFASATIELALASLLHKFDWSLPGGARPEELDVTEASGLAIHRKSPLLAVASLRSI